MLVDEREAREGCRVERFHEFPSFLSPGETTGIERREGEREMARKNRSGGAGQNYFRLVEINRRKRNAPNNDNLTK